MPDDIAGPSSKPLHVSMRVCELQHFKAHSDLDETFVSRAAQHPETRLELDAFVNPTITDQQIPGLVRILFRGVWIDVGHCTTSASGDNVYVDGISISASQCGQERRVPVDADGFPRIFRPWYISLDDYVGSEALDGDLLLTLLLQPGIQLCQ